MENLKFYCDNYRHLVCKPYSIENLHRMAIALGIDKAWFDGNKKHPHYDIPVKRIAEIKSKCNVVPRKIIMGIIREVIPK